MLFGFLLLLSQAIADGPPPPGDQDVDILLLTEEMKAFLDEEVIKVRRPVQRLRALAHVIFDKRFINMTYSDDFTRTGIEAFEDGLGNCLSFTAMFVAMARYVGIAADFQEVETSPTWDKKGDVVVLIRHVNALVHIENRDYIMDFNPYVENRARFSTPISDARALAHYYNNRGAELYASGEAEQALILFKKAIEVDYDLNYAWSGLALAHNNLGRPEEAERLLLETLERHDEDFVALNNLAFLYTQMGRQREAKQIGKKTKRFRHKNPFYHYSLAEKAMSNNKWKLAFKHLRTALRLRDVQPEFHYAMSEVHTELGHEKKAKASLGRAILHARTEEVRNKYIAELEKLFEE